jgi:hypothetical protein
MGPHSGPFHLQFNATMKHKWPDHEKPTHLEPILHEQNISFLHTVPTKARYEDITEVLECQCGDHQLAMVCCSLVKDRTQLISESLQ